jgi:hypothetical protein
MPSWSSSGEEGAHNFPIEVFHSTGLVGFIGYLALHAVAPIVALWRLTLGRVRAEVRWSVIAALGGYVGVFAAAASNLTYWNPAYWLLLGLMIAAVRLSECDVAVT